MSSAQPAQKKIAAAAAQGLFIKLHPLTYTVTAKFDDDHMTAAPNLSKKTSITSAIERYKKNQNITTSSWLLLDKETLKNKASGGRKIATTHSGAQQMTVEISVARRTVTIQVLTPRERQRYEHETVEISGQNHYLNCSSEEKDVKLMIVGPWHPLTGSIELYHYQEGTFPTAAAMLDKYLVWHHNGNTPTTPVATS